ncbi:MAG: LAGLIDADG endonuclease [bacterium]|nr:LAGLIDADG endonuclease [bacterium]
MVNTVGSLETKYWQSKWIKLKESLAITPEQRSLLIGSLLGDGTMRRGEGARNANYKVEHGLVQKSYVFWKYELLKPFVPTEPKLSYRYDPVKGKYPKSWWFRTIRHPLLTEIYNLWYVGDRYRTGRKIVPRTIEDDLTPLALAIWIMDDGSYARGTITISTYCFTTDEIELLCEALRSRYGIVARYHRDRDKGYRMYCNQSQTRLLIEEITPYIIPSMTYKIGFKTP